MQRRDKKWNMGKWKIVQEGEERIVEQGKIRERGKTRDTY
jgi:hypothetical protein